jgi:hypothetical protein
MISLGIEIVVMTVKGFARPFGKGHHHSLSLSAGKRLEMARTGYPTLPGVAVIAGHFSD